MFEMISWSSMCVVLTITVLLAGTQTHAAAEADPVISGSADLSHISQFQHRQATDARPRLSASQQAQILSDVQQHQRFPHSLQNPINSGLSPLQTGTSYSSLAKYKVDRNKQQQLQQLLAQQQTVQQLLQQQQQKISTQLGQNLLNPVQTQFQSKQRQQFQARIPHQYNDQLRNSAGTLQNLRQDLAQPFFTDQQSVQLQTFLENQRELEALQKQRQQLLLEQQELRRQQELLRIQQLRALTSTTPAPVSISSTVRAPAISTTSSPIILTSPTARRITPSETDLFLKAIATHQKKFTTTTQTPSIVKTTTRKSQIVTQENIPEDLLNLLREQQPQLLQEGKSKPQIKVIYQTESPIAKSSRGRSSESATNDKNLLLKQLKIALAESSDDEGIRNVTTRDLILPNGKKLQVIHAPNGLSSIVPTATSVTQSATTIKPPKAILDELTKGVLPPGADFEVIRQTSSGKLEEVGNEPIQSSPAKKVTFVVLEEQPDGSYKVQGVKGNVEKENGVDVDSIVEKIKKGELKLPPSSRSSTTAASIAKNKAASSGTAAGSNKYSSNQPTTFRPTTVRTTYKHSESKATSNYSPYVTSSTNFVSSTDKYVTSASNFAGHVLNSVGQSGTSARPSTVDVNGRSQSVTRYSTSTKNQFVPTMPPADDIVATTQSNPTTYSQSSSYIHYTPKLTSTTPRSNSVTPSANLLNGQSFDTIYREFEKTTALSTEDATSGNVQNAFSDSLAALLRREGLFAMSKYLRQSGLDTVLNETGPYTIFVPTDKAFRTLLVQLGGPEKAEMKFRDNPRLLSGLLLHHVIPGAFRIDSLQDEMTGVSLAGTQLRVNEYSMHDHEWNDVKVTTINGARIAPNKRDIEITQGIAHAIDRVMFPLPVGDLVQTLQADRERRFGTFLRMLQASGLEETLTGPKTFTIFAPTDAAFEAAATKQGNPVWTEADGADAAKAIVSKHIAPTTLYTAGMRYYIQKDTLRPQVPIHIHKNGGRVRVNEAHVVTHNVPATNGVLHAIDGVL